MQRTSTDLSVIRLIDQQKIEIDRRLPRWARRSNPIIRRQLGMYWKTILPEAGLLTRIIIAQVALVVISLPLPFMFNLALPAITASLLLFPLALYMYLQSLVTIGVNAATAMANEIRCDTFELLRSTPYSLGSILGSKIAASVWRQVENLSMLVFAVLLFSLPLLISQYATIWPLDQYPYLSRIGMIMGLIVSLVRLLIEPVMIAAVGVMAGAALPVRATAVLTTIVIGFFYFLFINLARLLPLAWPLRFAVEFIIPVALPLLISWGAFNLARYLLTRD
jgi:hypothetical protein